MTGKQKVIKNKLSNQVENFALKNSGVITSFNLILVYIFSNEVIMYRIDDYFLLAISMIFIIPIIAIDLIIYQLYRLIYMENLILHILLIVINMLILLIFLSLFISVYWYKPV